MTARAYVLIETAVGKTQEAANAVRLLPGVQTVDGLTGPYDMIAVVETPDLNAVGDLVTSQIHSVDGVVRTVTCLVVGGS